MPIFISRFSPDRGLVGLLQGPRAGRPEEQGVAQETPSERGLEGAVARQSGAPAQQAAPEPEQAPAAGRRRGEDGADRQAGEADSRRAVDGRDGLTAVGNTGLALTLATRRVEEQAQEVGPSERTARRVSGARLAEAQAGAAAQAGGRRNGRGDLQAIRDSNREAVEGADRADLRGVAQRLRGLLRGAGQREETEAGDEAARRTGREEGPATRVALTTEAGTGSDAQGTEQRRRAREGRNSDRAGEERGGAALPPADAQREAAREAAREVGRGLQRDAGIQNSRNAEQSARSAARVTENGQRQGVRESQTQARSLQAERRRLEQEIRQTEQQIRQLQGRGGAGSAAAAKAASALAVGSSVDILAQ
ncbi:MAG: hypothetical protein A3F84_06265 [Candidatus Handelsmanbacteria bacterium RIFCSPLOWO2_12_FULL_64_10]|uniref:Uncharacterized protein n=1 Tax=Handelsmanbacteria sp. (strain RIFCSPLOWO2_12_FULL_64_10) TaxID=1817868 RepID=A0A1F6CAD3_HANXR|nr:MAG: hypothetical protein A3F84_06265 [Candidatus Handelsmanbacteria bacterium RIFCSPLOWO2_12_FULL_64_10]